MSKRRVVVSGIGVISPVGNSKQEFWNSLCQGKSGIKRISQIEPSLFSSQVAGEVKDFHPEDFSLSPKEIRRKERFVQFALAATHEAIEDSNLILEQVNLERVGVLLGSGIGSLKIIEEQYKRFLQEGPGRISPFLIPKLITNMAAGEVAIHFGLQGPNFCITTACASASHALAAALSLLREDKADIIVSGGTESAITDLGLGGFCAARSLSTHYNDQPEKSSRPFDRKRDGFVMAEGAGILILEELDHALRRNAPIYCELAGYGMSDDAYHVTAPHPQGRGAAQCMALALKDAEVSPQDISYINAHGTSTILNDKTETLAIKKVFKDFAKKVPVSSTKSMTGHLLGAAGGVEAAVCCLAIKEKIIPPTINYEYPDPDCDLDYVPNTAREKDVRIALSNSLGFGGHNVSLIFKEYR
ncbi:MAG: beta-ketoacyl-ACP synthase II [Candidatus Omnitrophica bacterium]|nr:beta-ketoacyl-ACP synthase II [Candidatus Omnitrophota bacterium]